MRSMVICSPNGQQRTHYPCPCCCLASRFVPSDEPMDQTETIPIFYSPLEAVKNGWIFTKHPYYCDPDQQRVGVWVCPDCTKGVEFR